MRVKNHSTLLYVGSGNNKTQLQGPCDLPKILKDITLPNQQVSFHHDDVIKVIEVILSKGSKYLSLKKEMEVVDALRLEKKIIKSPFMQFSVRKVMTHMGDQRRLGAGLRGFSKLILQQFQQKCWPMIQLEAELMLKQFQQQQQRQKVLSLLSYQPNKAQST